MILFGLLLIGYVSDVSPLNLLIGIPATGYMTCSYTAFDMLLQVSDTLQD